MPHDPSVAIVGMGALFPDAPDLIRFWDNILNVRNAARDVPEGRWLLNADKAFDPEVGRTDHVYSRKGCFLETVPSVSSLEGLTVDTTLFADLDPLFHILLHAGTHAFRDAVTEPLDRSRIGVIIGNLALPTEKSALLSRRWLGRTFEERLLGTTGNSGTTDPLNRYAAGLPAGILAHSLGLGGGCFTLDAACASSLYAIKLAMDELLAGRCDAMLTGGVARPDPLYTQMGFSQLRALSKRGICSPFDAAADGLVVGEGAGLFLLKRTADAIAHGDRIYGIIRGIGLASDIGGSLLAPMSDGQLRAMRAAYRSSGWDPRSVDLIECHATGTPVGDATEFSSLSELWGGSSLAVDRCVIGSVKSNIGHLLTAAGSAALAKVLLAFREETLPPTAGFISPQPGMDLEGSPFRILVKPSPWHRRNDSEPRRAAVSAFGFGGINAHLLVEEWVPPVTRSVRSGSTETRSPERPLHEDEAPIAVRSPVAVVGLDARFGPWKSKRAFQERVLGGDPNAATSVPDNWWGAPDSAWYRQEGLADTPFSGHYIDGVASSQDQFRIPPREIEEMLPQQLLMLQVAAGALEDAGIGRDENDRTGVFIGIALDLNSTNFSYRWSLIDKAPAIAKTLGYDHSVDDLNEWTSRLLDSYGPPLTANRTMGALGSIVASRIAREFKVGGPSFTLSSEENSGVRAVETAVRMLQQGEIDRAVAGAVDLAGDLRSVLGHHAVRPLSRSGQGLPFDKIADGSIVGEGAAAVVLKRLEDAERDGDRIYAVIRGIGSTSGTLLLPGTAPYSQALEKACAEAEITPAQLDCIEAHASGHPAEDRMEARSLATLFSVGQDGASPHPPRSCALTSVKGDIGHCGAASGIASFVRACLSLYHEIIPSCRHTDNPLIELAGPGPFYLPRTPRYWLRNRSDGPRRYGLSSFSIDGNCCHMVLEGCESQPSGKPAGSFATMGTDGEGIFTVGGRNEQELQQKLEELRSSIPVHNDSNIYGIAHNWHIRELESGSHGNSVAFVARNAEELRLLVTHARTAVAGRETDAILTPSLRDRFFHSASPLGSQGTVAFVFPGSGNHFPGMGVELSSRWPDIFRNQDSENLYLRDQYRPDMFWNGASLEELNSDHKAVIFGQVATGTAVSDIVRSFGILPRAVIGYSLGESAGFFALRAWRDRDAMLTRMHDSTLFTSDLAGECRAAHQAWGFPVGREVSWAIGVVEASAREVRHALRTTPRVYLLIVNTPDECVIGGDAKGVKRLVAMLGCRYFPLSGVTTVHCEVAQEVAVPYRELHLFPTSPPPGVNFYSGASGAAYPVDRESAADAILAQALKGVDYPAVIESAYRDGVRIFLEMGPGASCSRMIGRILAGRPHLARSACQQSQDPVSSVYRMLANLVAEQVPVDLSQLFQQSPPELHFSSGNGKSIRLAVGGKFFTPPLPPARVPLSSDPAPPEETPAKLPLYPVSSASFPMDSVIQGFVQSQDAQVKAHDAFLRFSDTITRAMADALSHQLSLQQALGFPDQAAPVDSPRPAFGRDLCLEFARGSVARMLGPSFAEADTFPTRVRLPDEPLMLVDRILTVEGEPRSMSPGRVVTEHDITSGSWYLDGGRIPTCIAVEAGQADLFLSGYLGIDFITRGLAVYRLLDAVVTFHRGLPGPGETIHYDIRIERFFRQGETHLFRFGFNASVNGEPLLTMRDGCAGFFTEEALAAGKGIVRPALDLRPTTGSRPADWAELVPMAVESYTAEQLDLLRNGDLAGCFGPFFARLQLAHPLTIPGNRMRLVHRVIELDPTGGRYGLGLIRAEADIFPSDWFLTCHFVDDRVMPGTLMYECCLHTLRIFLLRMGWVAETETSAWEPVPGVASQLRCRGQVLETTKIAGYEVTIREIGYLPEPYAIVDALMYADGKPIVEIVSMSVRLTGTTRELLLQCWQGTSEPPESSIRKTPVYTKEQILAYSNGNPSEGFGEPYRIFDSGRKIARLPGPPFQFMDRITAVSGKPWQMTAGAMVEAQYDVPVDAWYFTAERQQRMPFAVLLEAALQPCGWLAAYVGSALTSPVDLCFRNLGGSAVQHRAVRPDSGTLTATAVLKKAAASGGMIIQEFDFKVVDRYGTVYEGDTMFGFFSADALANQVGIRDTDSHHPTPGESARGRSLPYPETTPFPDRTLRMIDTIKLFVPDGGPAGLGYLRGIKSVDPDEWFFKAHFYQDPVTPGSLGLESFLQLLKFAAAERWGCRSGEIFASVALKHRHRWLYRGQIVPSNREVSVEAWITAADDRERILTADGLLSVDDRPIYQMNDFTVQLEPSP